MMKSQNPACCIFDIVDKIGRSLNCSIDAVILECETILTGSLSCGRGIDRDVIRPDNGFSVRASWREFA